MLLPALVVSGLFAQAPLFAGGVVEYPADAGEAVVPSSAQVTVQGGQYLVVWADARRDLGVDADLTVRRQDVWAARVDTNGTGASAPVGTLVCAAAPGARFLEPKVAGDGGETLVVWREEVGGLSSLRASVLHGDGGMTRNCGQVLVGPSDAGLVNHQVAFGPEGYLVTWEEPHRLKGRFVEADELAGARPVLTLGGTFPPSMSFAPPPLRDSAAIGTSAGYLVTWSAVGADSRDVYANVVSGGAPVASSDAGVKLAPGVKSSTLVSRWRDSPVLLFTTPNGDLGGVTVTAEQLAIASFTPGVPLLAVPGSPLHGVYTGTSLLVSYLEPTANALRVVDVQAGTGPRAAPVQTTWGLASAGAGAMLVGTSSTGELFGAGWANGSFTPPTVPIGFALAAQQQPSLAWTTDGWVLGWRRVLPSAPLEWAGNLALLDTGGRLRTTHGIETSRRFMGLSARPDAGVGALLAHTVDDLRTSSAVSPLRAPLAGAANFTVAAPTTAELAGGASLHHATGAQVSVLWLPGLGTSEAVRVLPQRTEVDTGQTLGRCAALTPGKLWLVSAEGNGGTLWAVPDDGSADVSSPPTRSFSLVGLARGRPCVAADGARLLVAVETTEGLETTGWHLDEDRQLEPRVLAPPPNRRLSAPVVAAGPGGFVIVSEGRSLAGVRAGLAILIAHARWPDDSVSEPVVVGDMESADETNAQLVPSGGKLLLAWERFDGREAVVSRTLSLVPPALDAGVPDAGIPDGGSTDAGALEDGGVDPTPLVPFTSCGCATDGGLALGLWLAALARSRRRR